MSDNKKYYYLKLKDNFYDSEQMIILQNMQDGYLYSDILMKLYLRSLKTEGKLMFNNMIPYTPQVLAQVVRHQVGTVEKALQIFRELGLIEVLDNGAIYMLDIQNFIGESSTEGDRKRKYRQRIKAEEADNKALPEGQGQMSAQMSDKRPPEIEIDIEIEKDIEIDINKKKKNIKKKNESSHKKEKTDIDEVISQNISDDDLKATMYEFIKMRKAIKKPLTTRGLELIIQKLFKLSNVKEEQILILNKSIMNNWQGIFELKPEDKHQLERPKEYKEVELTEDEYIKKLNERGKKYV